MCVEVYVPAYVWRLEGNLQELVLPSRHVGLVPGIELGCQAP